MKHLTSGRRQALLEQANGDDVPLTLERRFWGKRNDSRTGLVQTFGIAGTNLRHDGLRTESAKRWRDVHSRLKQRVLENPCFQTITIEMRTSRQALLAQANGDDVPLTLERFEVTVFRFLKNATVRGRAWHKLLDAPVQISYVTVFR